MLHTCAESWTICKVRSVAIDAAVMYRAAIAFPIVHDSATSALFCHVLDEVLY